MLCTKEPPQRSLANISVETSQARRETGMIYLKCLKKKILAKLSFRIEGEIESFPDKEKIKKFINTRPDLQEMLKELL